MSAIVRLGSPSPAKRASHLAATGSGSCRRTGSKSETPAELELARRVHRGRNYAEVRGLSGIVKDRPHAGHVGHSQLGVVGDVVGRNLEAKIALLADREVLVERDVDILGAHRAHMIEVGRRRSRNERISEAVIRTSWWNAGKAEAGVVEPPVCRVGRAFAGVAPYIGALVEVGG